MRSSLLLLSLIVTSLASVNAFSIPTQELKCNITNIYTDVCFDCISQWWWPQSVQLVCVDSNNYSCTTYPIGTTNATLATGGHGACCIPSNTTACSDIYYPGHDIECPTTATSCTCTYQCVHTWFPQASA